MFTRPTTRWARLDERLAGREVVTAPQSLFEQQLRYRWTAKRFTADERRALLSALKDAILANADEVMDALTEDLGRPRAFSKVEIATVVGDIDDAVEHLDEWIAPTAVAPAAHFGAGARAEVRYEARGVVLLFGPWNFPFSLVFQPLVAIVAAGNCCLVKPNEVAPATSAVTARIIGSVFEPYHVAALEGGVELANALLDLPFDHIFFTGSPAVGRTVMGKAAQHLASVTLELGGKCPAVVDASADITLAAKQIAIGKHQNSGQICLSPDHVWVHEDVRDEFIGRYLEWVEKNLYADGQLSARRFGRLINERNAKRVRGYVIDAVERGATRTALTQDNAAPLVVEPVVLTGVDMNAAVMKEEIFGPVLPVLTYRELSTAVEALRSQSKPLAMYIFSRDDAVVNELLAATSSGGATVNGWALHSSETGLPFGGVGDSGMGRYHGIHGFRELSHERSVFLAAPRPSDGS
jgi:aldehyde dehydrogenase (NAD+)